MLDGGDSKNLESVITQKKRRRRGRLLYSSKRELERSKMRVSKQMTRLTGLQKSLALRIDFGEEDITNIASTQEVLATKEKPEGTNEDYVKFHESDSTQTIVSQYF